MAASAPTIIQEYIFAAIKHAVVVADDGEPLCVYVPELPGVRAYGRDIHECLSELYRLIDMGIPVWLANGHELPVLDGIDLNGERGEILSTYHRGTPPEEPEREFFADEDELKRAFERHMRSL